MTFDLRVSVGTFDLEVRHAATGHRVALVGPSGAGKSLTLRAVAGLLGAGVGAVRFGARDVSDAPAYRRRVGYVPQGVGLLPDRTVWEQVCFGVDADPARAAWWMTTLQLDGLAERYPEELSGGQRQRVGIARALAPGPDILLLDEPFSALDVPVRAELRRELRRLQRTTGLSTVLVTHDPLEAAVLADEIVVVSHGRVLQAGPASEVLRRPASVDVGRLLGMDNLRDTTLGGDRSVTLGGRAIRVDVDAPAGSLVLWHIPPDAVQVRRDVTAVGRGTVVDVVDLGSTVEITVDLDGGQLRACVAEAPELGVGDRCTVDVDPAAVRAWRGGQ